MLKLVYRNKTEQPIRSNVEDIAMDSTDPGRNELDRNGSEHEVLPPPPPVIPPDVVPVQAEQQPDNTIQAEKGPAGTRILQVPVMDSSEPSGNELSGNNKDLIVQFQQNNNLLEKRLWTHLSLAEMR
ncbi:hypothetical protein Tsubulata_003825 [Turnera subulata]|uniref:Uncharacterized protein n=1 Tax=Turnera subulata TaxID=218843 RepID=A0A9Q0JRB0_9ROSI|nr:hypothetical protein Tsubulata_003825 [Turnera subulata]